MKTTILLRNSILGWMLVAKDGSAISAIPFMNELYGADWLKLKPSQRAFMSGKPIKDVVEHFNNVCQKLKISVSFCGKKYSPTIRLWRQKPFPNLSNEKVRIK